MALWKKLCDICHYGILTIKTFRGSIDQPTDQSLKNVIYDIVSLMRCNKLTRLASSSTGQAADFYHDQYLGLQFRLQKNQLAQQVKSLSFHAALSGLPGQPVESGNFYRLIYGNFPVLQAAL